MFENMRMENLITPFETFRVITYNADQTKALYKNKSMQLITGNIYRGETIKEEYNDHCDVYAIYDGIAVGIWIGSVRTDYSVDEVMEHIRRKGMDSLENYMAAIKTRLEKQDHFRFTEIEFIKHIAPELENQMWESRKAFAASQALARFSRSSRIVIVVSSLMFQKIEPLVETVYRAALRFGIFGFLRVGFTLCRDLIHQGVDHSGFGIQHGNRRRFHVLRDLRPCQDIIGKAKLHRLVRVHPGFRVHQMGQLGAGQPGLDLIGVNDGILHTAKHLDGFLHLCGVTHGHRHGIVDHHHGHRADQNFCTSHSDHACRRRCNAIDFDRDIMRIIHEHIVDLGSRHTVPAWAVDPDLSLIHISEPTRP